MYPLSPQPVPHEFLIFQLPPTTPTNSTPWFSPVLQLLKTPFVYRCQLVASTATETTWLLIAVDRPLQLLTSTCLLFLKDPATFLQLPSAAVQGQADSVVMPLASTQRKALSIRPPLHPLLPQDRLQSTSCCSLNLCMVPLALERASREPVEEKAQQEPQLPWFLTGVTKPLATQSTSAPTVQESSTKRLRPTVVWRPVRQRAENSWEVRSAKELAPREQVLAGLLLCCSMVLRLALKTESLQASSSGEAYSRECLTFQWPKRAEATSWKVWSSDCPPDSWEQVKRESTESSPTKSSSVFILFLPPRPPFQNPDHNSHHQLSILICKLRYNISKQLPQLSTMNRIGDVWDAIWVSFSKDQIQCRLILPIYIKPQIQPINYLARWTHSRAKCTDYLTRQRTAQTQSTARSTCCCSGPGPAPSSLNRTRVSTILSLSRQRCRAISAARTSTSSPSA